MKNDFRQGVILIIVLFWRIDRCLRGTRSFHARSCDRGRNRHVRTAVSNGRTSAAILYELSDYQYASSFSRNLCFALVNVEWSTEWTDASFWHAEGASTWKKSDCPLLLEFVRWSMDQMRNDQQFTYQMLLIDEITFTRDGMFNMNNAHIWSIKNP